MARVFSLNARRAFTAGQTSDVAINLMVIRCNDLPAPVRLSSDPTERITTDPLTYGTRSNGEIYNFILMAAVVPDDIPGTPPSAQIIIENVSADVAKQFRNAKSPVYVDMYIVFASAPDFVEQVSWLDLRLTNFTFGDENVSLNFSHEVLTSEPYPSQRMTRSRFPGLFR